MTDAPTNRRLAAILAADVVGYSSMMAADEMGTLSALKRHREQVFEPAVARNNGRTFKLIGDGTLVEFASVVDAVRCALDIQTAIGAEPEPEGGGPHIRLRIGVNLGDVIIDGDDVYGDGVNVAARLEPLAPHGGVCISSIVKESVGTRLDVDFADGGEVQVKNIQRPIRVWSWEPGNRGEPARAPDQANHPPRIDDKPEQQPVASIAVLPFDNMSGDPEQEYFSDGISEDIITDLSKVAGFLVIARNSSFAYKGRAIDLRQVGRELGATKILEGSIRRAGNRVRINAQLIDATTGGHIWAERFDRDLTDIFEVQDEVTLRIVKALRVQLTPAEEARLTTVETTSPEAHDAFLRGREMLAASLGTREDYEKTRTLFQQALERDPDYAEAHAGLAMAYGFNHLNRWTEDHPEIQAKALRHARRAVELSPDSPVAHYVLSVQMTLDEASDPEEALAETVRALELNPNYAPAHNALGVYEIYQNRPADALPHIEKALRIDPNEGQQYLHFLGLAHLLLGNYETATATFRERIARFPATDLSRSLLASTLGHLGEIEEAGRVWDEMKQINPNYDFQRHMGNLRFADRSAKDLIAEGLRKAGLPR